MSATKHRGMILYFDPEDGRGHIAGELGAPDVVFAGSILFDTHRPRSGDAVEFEIGSDGEAASVRLVETDAARLTREGAS